MICLTCDQPLVWRNGVVYPFAPGGYGHADTGLPYCDPALESSCGFPAQLVRPQG